MCTKVEELARVIVGAGADSVQLSYARLVAEAQLDLVRVQDAMVALMNSYLAEVLPPNAAVCGNDITSNSQKEDCIFESDGLIEGSCTQERSMTPTIEILRRLSRLERYERRAISRRRRAMRAFVSHREMCSPAIHPIPQAIPQSSNLPG